MIAMLSLLPGDLTGGGSSGVLVRRGPGGQPVETTWLWEVDGGGDW
eukprot:SAG22_NODE_2177_length_2882_cov_4.041682_2_plen_46_part_00